MRRVPSSEHLKMGLVTPLLLFIAPADAAEPETQLLHEGAGDIKTADGDKVLALTGVRDLRRRQRSAVFDLYSPFKLLKTRVEFLKVTFMTRLSNEHAVLGYRTEKFQGLLYDKV